MFNSTKNRRMAWIYDDFTTEFLINYSIFVQNRINFTEFYNNFSLDSMSKISKDPKLARKIATTMDGKLFCHKKSKTSFYPPRVKISKKLILYRFKITHDHVNIGCLRVDLGR